MKTTPYRSGLHQKVADTEANLQAGLAGTFSGYQWVDTIINATKSSAPNFNLMREKTVWWLHVLLWVIATGMSSWAGFGANGMLSESENVSTVPAGDGSAPSGQPSPPHAPPPPAEPSGMATFSDTSNMIGIFGGTCAIIAVCSILFSAAMYDTSQYQSKWFLTALIQLTSSYSTIAMFYILTIASKDAGSLLFWVSLIALIVDLMAMSFMYSMLSKIEASFLARLTIGAFTISVQFIAALAMSSGDFHAAANTEQKVLAFMAPLASAIALTLVVLLRKLVVDLIEYPIYRSTVLFFYAGAAALSLYYLSHARHDTHNEATVRSLL
jgi:hypothetical protein